MEEQVELKDCPQNYLNIRITLTYIPSSVSLHKILNGELIQTVGKLHELHRFIKKEKTYVITIVKSAFSRLYGKVSKMHN